MNFQRPFEVVTPTLDGDVLTVLARADAEMSGREIHRLAGRGSEQGVRRAAERLTRQGILLRRPAGRAHLYRLNRAHLGAPFIEGLAGLRQQLIELLRDQVASWKLAPRAALIFGSFARAQAGAESDLDLLVVRPAGRSPDAEVWQDQIAKLQRAASAWTGNDARVLEYGEEELRDGMPEAVIEEALVDGIELHGSRRALRRLVQAAAT